VGDAALGGGIVAWKPIEVTAEAASAATRRFSKKTRFQADESVPDYVVDYIRSRRFNVKTATESGLKGHSDEDHLAAAHRDSRVLLTFDQDFLDERKFPPHRNPGIVVLPRGVPDSKLGRAIGFMLTYVAPVRMAWWNATITISPDGQITVRSQESESGRRRTWRYKVGRRQPESEWIEDEPSDA